MCVCTPTGADVRRQPRAGAARGRQVRAEADLAAQQLPAPAALAAHQMVTVTSIYPLLISLFLPRPLSPLKVTLYCVSLLPFPILGWLFSISYFLFLFLS